MALCHMQAQMSAEADAFIGIPGGFGTLEELLEMVTWQQLGLHTKPVGVLNMRGYFDHLLDFFDHAVEEVGPPRILPCLLALHQMHAVLLLWLEMVAWQQLGLVT